MGPVSLSTFAYGRCDLTTANGTSRTCRVPLTTSVDGHKADLVLGRIRPPAETQGPGTWMLMSACRLLGKADHISRNEYFRFGQPRTIGP